VKIFNFIKPKSSIFLISFVEYLKQYIMYNSVLLLFTFGPTEIIVILVIVLLLFGGKKIPELMKGVGKGINEFKKGTKEEDKEDKDKKD